MHSDIDDVLLIPFPKQEPVGAAGSDGLGPSAEQPLLLLGNERRKSGEYSCHFCCLLVLSDLCRCKIKILMTS